MEITTGTLVTREPIPPAVRAFMRNHHNGRITQRSMQAIEDAPDILMSCVYGAGRLLAVSVALLDGSASCTVTHGDYRQQGFGSKALREKTRYLGERYRAIVAHDNVASNALLRSTGAHETKRTLAQRRSGEFTQIHYALANFRFLRRAASPE